MGKEDYLNINIYLIGNNEYKKIIELINRV